MHYNEGNGRTSCTKKITNKIKVTKDWSKVTCTDCKKINNSGWKEMN